MSEPRHDRSQTGTPPVDFVVLRGELMARGFHEDDLDPDPMAQFAQWYQFAHTSQIYLPEAMTLATASAEGKPSARMVLLKGFDARGFVFFTNYESRKGLELAANPNAALILYWKEFDRQIRIEGTVRRTSDAESDAYFQSRPWGSRVSATVSVQSAVVPNRTVLERGFAETTSRYPDGRIPRPESWGGYRVIPTSIEFWQGRDNRLHDRLCYTRTSDGGWQIDRLSP